MSVDLYHVDCLEYMREQPDKSFDLACVDPPYGIGRFEKGGSHLNKYGEPGAWNSAVPAAEYFEQLQRVSVNQIIFGGNYFDLPKTGGWIFWDKDKNQGDKANFADGELAWTNFLSTLKIARIRYDGFVGADLNRIHPTQKPYNLYAWIFRAYTKPGQRILDTHLGSGSSALAAHYLGCDLVGCEIDPNYYTAAVNRFNQETKQQAMAI